MPTEAKKASRPAPEGDEAAQAGLFQQLGLITRAISHSGVARVLAWLVLGLVLVPPIAWLRFSVGAP